MNEREQVHAAWPGQTVAATSYQLDGILLTELTVRRCIAFIHSFILFHRKQAVQIKQHERYTK